jgi:hypothetical protein
MYLSGSGQGQVESPCECVMNLRVPLNFWDFSLGCTTSGLLSSAQVHRVN